MGRYVAYYWFRSGFGTDEDAALKAQRDAVRTYVSDHGKLIDELKASQHNMNIRFEKAIRIARRKNAILLIPDITFLYRKLDVTKYVKKYGVNIIAIDGTEPKFISEESITTRLTHELESSRRIKKALQDAKDRGVRLGNPDIISAQRKAVAVAREHGRRITQNSDLKQELARLRRDGLSFHAIAQHLNDRGIPTARRKRWHASTVRNILNAANCEAIL